jgi:DNA-binding LacI/PurR family transcriptional regulator
MSDLRQTAKPTSADVAREARVSRATVSYVLNDVDNQTISNETRQAVLAAA